jgi:hypothetical protein
MVGVTVGSWEAFMRKERKSEKAGRRESADGRAENRPAFAQRATARRRKERRKIGKSWQKSENALNRKIVKHS